MTCIVGIAHKGSVYMGGDSCGSSISPGWVQASKYVLGKPKVFERDEILFGYTSSFRLGQLLQHALVMPALKHPIVVDEFVYGPLIEAIRKCFATGGYGAVKDGRSESGGLFMMGLCGRLFLVQEDFAVLEPSCGFAAVGGGAEVAIGAMHVALKRYRQDLKIPGLMMAIPREIFRIILTEGLEAASAFSTGVESPFHFVDLESYVT